jgi:hypothetical protein
MKSNLSLVGMGSCPAPVEGCAIRKTAEHPNNNGPIAACSDGLGRPVFSARLGVRLFDLKLVILTKRDGDEVSLQQRRNPP